MREASDFSRLADFLGEPVFLLETGGTVSFANRAARELLGHDIAGRDLGERLSTPPEEFRRYLLRCAGSNRPTIGSVAFRLEAEERKVQLDGALFRPAADGEPAAVIVRVSRRGAEAFSILGRKIDELNREIRQRRRAQAALEESLAEKDTLLSELQHRTKNHTQMLLGMFAAAGAGATTEEARAVIGTALARLRSIGAAQQLMYEVKRFDTVPSKDLVEGTCGAIAETWPPSVELSVSAEDAALPNDIAVPVALILNELMSNALKHGLDYGAGRVAVSLSRAGPDLVLEVSDSGRGMPEAATGQRSSGLSIVRGLCRQVGGMFETSNQSGMKATVRFPNPELKGGGQ